MSDILNPRKKRTKTDTMNKPLVQMEPCSYLDTNLMKHRLSQLMKVYHFQLKTGCGSPDTCEQPLCKSNKAFSIEDEKIWDECKRLSKDGFRKEAQEMNPVYYLCKNLNLPTRLLQYDILSLDILRARQSDKPLFQATVKAAFSSPKAMSHSFLQPGIYIGSDEATLDNIGTQLEEVNDTFAFLQEDQETKEILLVAMEKLCQTLAKESHQFTKLEELRPIAIAFQYPEVSEIGSIQNRLLPPLLQAICKAPIKFRNVFTAWWSRLPKPQFERLALHTIQTYITIQLNIAQFVERPVAEAVIILGILWEANKRQSDDLEETLILYKDFYNDGVSNQVNLEKDYQRWRNRPRDWKTTPDYWKHFCFINYPFLLDAATKAEVLKYDSNQQRRDNFFQNLLQGSAETSYLILHIDRQNLIQAALQELDLKRDYIKNPLRVKFSGEDGIDEGGVSKEFFQLTIKELFDAQFGMFVYNDKTGAHWFNPHAFESQHEFRLVGMLFGLAIYNSIILEIRFPLALYKKMLGLAVGLKDLYHLDAELYKGFSRLLEFDEAEEGATVEDTFCRNFTIEAEVYGATVVIPLKENGSEIVLTKDNRQEYVDLYTHYLLVKSIEKQYDAFNSGFQTVAGGEVLQMFCPEELELLICGSPELDFESLEKECKYDGFTGGSQYIKDFWDIVHNQITDTDRKGLLKFCTGSDRVPIKGLKSMLFVIIKNGDDSDRLPTAHTCFNYLLLPHYETKEKLKTKLLAAINNCTGFGLE